MFKNKSTILLVIGLVVGALSGYQLGINGFDANLNKFPPEINIKNSTSPQNIDFSEYWKVWEILRKNSIYRNDISAKDMVVGSMKGLASSFKDPYTHYLNTKENQQLTETIEGKYSGIGAELGVKENNVIVVSPLDGSPAKKAGLKAGDYILSVDKKNVVGMNINEVVNLIRGEKGTNVTLQVIKKGEEATRDITITRDEIHIDSVSWKDKGNGIAYIRVSRFGTNTNAEWNSIVDEILEKIGSDKLQGVIIDVRQDPGGVLNSAVHLASEFLDKDTPVIWQETADGTQTPYNSTRKGKFKDLNLNIVVLIDGGSASASEILAGALRDNANAVLIGVKSFGKGTIQESVQLENNDALNVTIAKWLTPTKEWVHKIGITPDIQVKIPDDFKIGDADPQLAKAIEVAGMEKSSFLSNILEKVKTL